MAYHQRTSWARWKIARACVRYFGRLPTRRLEHAEKLCELLDSPQPGSVDSPTNPPASYWEALWETWNWMRRDVTWSLQQITGEVFRPAEGEHPSDREKALEYVRSHKERLGLE